MRAISFAAAQAAYDSALPDDGPDYPDAMQAEALQDLVNEAIGDECNEVGGDGGPAELAVMAFLAAALKAPACFAQRPAEQGARLATLLRDWRDEIEAGISDARVLERCERMARDARRNADD